MNKIQKIAASVVAGGALLVNGLLPVLASTQIVISGNGTGSDNDANVTLSTTTTVVQSNTADVFNDVEANAETGDNEAKDNTGGDVSIETGDADTSVKVDTSVNRNAAEVDCCPGGNVEVLISGNGSDSDNTANVGLASQVLLDQSNVANVTNLVEADAETGGNKAEDNTGGSVSIDTGDASITIGLTTEGNANSAKVGGGNQSGSLSAQIVGNGTHTDNDIILGLNNQVWFVQDNLADVFNWVDAWADSGHNKAEDNTGGEVSIETGDADIDVDVDNEVNFNWAEGDCGCLLEDLLVKVADNGSDTDNTIKAVLGQELGVIQANGCDGEPTKEDGECELEALVEADAETGKNKVEDSTGDPGDDPTIETGDADTDVEINNSGNSNVYGATPDWEMPGFDFDFQFSFDLSDLLEWLADQG